MIIQKTTNIWFLIILFLGLFFIQIFFQNRFLTKKNFFQPSLLKEIKIPLEKYFVLDSIGYVSGLRKVVSDIAWIQLLQYYGTDYYELKDENTPEENIAFTKYLNEHASSHDHCEHRTKIQPGRYKKFLQYCQRVIRLDHNFSFVYFYGSGALAWNLERPDEALDLISEGIKNLEYQKYDSNSDYWTLILYQSAIIYKKGEKYKELIGEIEKIVAKGKAPNLVKSILANLYKKFEQYDNAIKVWQDILSTGDPEYFVRAQQQIQEIMKIKSKR
ncbi:MAG: hypothetical protein SNJ64_02545 [Endomicrobiia bacterium]